MDDGKPKIASRRRSGGDGVPEIFCVDEQTFGDIDLSRWRLLSLATLTEEGIRGGVELSVMFIDEQAMADLNSQYMGKSGPTDVLAFPIDATELVISQGPGAITHSPSQSQYDTSDIPLLLGDVLICPSVAHAQSATHAGTYDDELALLLVHGILHILGHDHEIEVDAQIMRNRELDILQKHHWNGPAPITFRQEHVK
ncbi:hypothetical protein LBMAG13_02320 [Actinomycetes bacterium]|nr:hypothetical protein LBMAG13_02320 [Actinomycetes bacterium]